MANICQCGCGQELPENSTRQYKRGHKNKIDSPEPDSAFTEVPIDPENDEPENELFSLEDAANLTPDDPEPRDVPEVKVKAAAIKITAAVRRDVEGKLAFAFGMSGQLWVLADPICGNAFMDHSGEIAKKLTPIICQSPDVVKWLTKSSNFILWIDLFMAIWPVAQIIFAHHIAKSLRMEEPQAANGQAPIPPNAYVVQ